MTINVNGGSTLWTLKQQQVAYRQGVTRPVEPTGVLAPVVTVITPNNFPTYSSGRVLSQYSNTFATASLQNFYVNYDPASTVVDQQTPVALLSSEWVNNSAGVDVTNVTQTIQDVNVLPLIVGQYFIDYFVKLNNDPTIWTALQTKFKLQVVSQIEVFGNKATLYVINGVN